MIVLLMKMLHLFLPVTVIHALYVLVIVTIQSQSAAHMLHLGFDLQNSM